MPWFKVDDKLHDHRKPRRAGVGSTLNGVAAIGLWTLAGSYASDNVTDGFVPEHTLTRWTPSLPVGRKLAELLVEAGLWVADEHEGEPGWRFHEWTERNPDASSVKAKRAAESEGGVRGNHSRWHEGRNLVDPECPFCVTPASGTRSGTRSGEARVSRIGGESSRPVPVPSRPESVVQVVSQSCSLTRVDDDGLTRIAELTRGDKAHAEAVAELVLSKTQALVKNPTAYVLAAIREAPSLYRYRRGNPKKGQQCPDHEGEWADACRAHEADRKASS